MKHTAESAELSILRRRKALARLAVDGALLAPARDGRSHGVYPKGDRRRRALAKLSHEEVHVLLAEGAITRAAFAGTYRLSGPGHAFRARDAADFMPWRSQHGAIVERQVMDDAGVFQTMRGTDLAGPFARLARVVEAGFFNAREIAAARTLFEDWAKSQRGLVAGSNWTAPPRGSTSRGPGGAQETAANGAIDARRRVDAALGALPLSLSGAVSAAVIEGANFADLERARRWPARSGKLVLKLALELLANHYEGAR
jgi:Domain of unknown function (DUF6456)